MPLLIKNKLFMDNKRGLSGLLVQRKGAGIRDKREEDESARFCNRIGCNGRLNYAKGVQIGCSTKSKLSTPSASSNGKEIVKIPSIFAADIADRKRALSQRKSNSNQKPENDGLDGGIFTSVTRTRKVIGAGNKELGFRKTKLLGAGSSSASSNIRSWRTTPAMLGDGKQNKSTRPNVSSSSKATSSMTCCGLINVKSRKISDVNPGSPPMESKVNKRGEIRRRDSDVESSSSGRGKKTTGRSSNQEPSPQPKSGIFVSDERSIGRPTSGVSIGPVSKTNGRSRQINSRVAHSAQGKRNSAPPGDSTLSISGSRKYQTPNNSELNASYQHSLEASSSSPYTTVGSTSDVLGPVPSTTSTEVGITRFRNRDAYRQYTIDDIAEVLMDLERIEQNGELTYERLLSLDTNLLLNSLNVFDQHRDMRMDIDNMSYEELLALEERMGTVSTALSEEAITKCLHKSIYQPHTSYEEDLDIGNQNDIKCSICQDEYVVGDEIGNLGCEHSYHVHCIEQWLRVKNWCPVCKGSAAETDSSISNA